jgi:DNA invertase Pin-like site-specific DNA recombinase
MRTAFYVRVSTERQQQAQTIEQQVALLRTYVAERPDWVVEEQHIFRDDGHTGARSTAGKGWWSSGGQARWGSVAVAEL